MWRGGSMRYGPWWELRRHLWSRGQWCIGLLLALCLQTSPAYAQSGPLISPIGLTDYQQYKSDLAIVSVQLQSYEEALRQALGVSASIKLELQQAREDLENYKASSMQSYQSLLQRVETLRQQLQDSDALVIALQSSLDLAKSEYSGKLAEVEKRALALERERNLWRGVCAVLAALAAGFGVWAAVK